MSKKHVEQKIAQTFLEIAEALEGGWIQKTPVIGIAAEGSEHGRENLEEAVRLAESRGCKAVLVEGEDVHKIMEDMLECGEIDGAVTMHYPFPIGVSTIGRVITPGKGKEMYIAATTGTSDTDRVCSLIKNAVYGIIAAKSCGVKEPTVGIANVDGARQCEKALLKLAENGYPIKFAQSARAEGGIVMRGNDLLAGTPDVMVMDSLTGNLMMKIFSSFTTGGSYESLGWGYGPGVGKNFSKTILIISRASGAPVIAAAVEYASNLVREGFHKIADVEFEKAKKAGLDDILKEVLPVKENDKKEAVAVPPKEVVAAQIPGIEVMDLEEAVSALWRQNIYAESGMGCTGPIIRINEVNKAKAEEILKESGYL